MHDFGMNDFCPCYNLICISETYFDSLVLERDRSLQLHGYNLITADHPSDTKEGVFPYIIKCHDVPVK